MAQTITGKAVASIMNSRILVPASMTGRSIVLTIQGNGNVQEVKNKAGEPVASYDGTGVPFEKKIFNCKANSEIAMKNPRNKAILMAAIKGEKSASGKITFTLNDKEGAKEFSAHDLYNAYLNKVQFSFNIPLPSPTADQIGDRDEISAKVQLIKTDNGELLTLDPKSIKVLEPEVLGTTSFSLPEFEEDVADVFAEDEFAGMDRAALIAKGKKFGLSFKKADTDDKIRAAVKEAAMAEEEA